MNEVRIVRNCLADDQKMKLGGWLGQLADDTGYIDQTADSLAKTAMEILGRSVTPQNIENVVKAWYTPITLKGTRKKVTGKVQKQINVLTETIVALEKRVAHLEGGANAQTLMRGI